MWARTFIITDRDMEAHAIKVLGELQDTITLNVGKKIQVYSLFRITP